MQNETKISSEGLQVQQEKIVPAWIKCEEELPPCDGYYKISDFAAEYYAAETAFYDGYGFVQLECYVEPKYWRKSRTDVKKYGKTLLPRLSNSDRSSEGKDANSVDKGLIDGVNSVDKGLTRESSNS